jgi:uncharacterized membrane protein YgcG
MVTSGATATYINDIAVTPFFGFSSTVAVSCTVPAQETTCSVNPASYPLAGGFGTGTLSVTTTARGGAIAGTMTDRPTSDWPIWRGPVIAVFLFAILVASVHRQQRLIGAPLLSLLLLVSIGVGLAGCGGGGSGGGGSGGSGSGGSGSGGGGGTVTANGTPAGSYTVTVTGTSGTLTHTTTLTLVVQ